MADGNGQALTVREHGGIDRRTDRAAFEPESFEQLRGLSIALSKSGLMPYGLDTPEKVSVAIMMGRELGLSVMQACRGIHVIEGKPTLSSSLIVGLCVRETSLCRYFRLVESTDLIATYETWREGSPEPVRLSYTHEQAAKAGLLAPSRNGKPSNHVKHPAAMLRARCETALARAVYPDLVGGLYDPDELRKSPDDEPVREVPRDVTPRPVTVTVEPSTAPIAPAATTKANDEPVDEPVDEPASGEPVTDEATGEVAVSFAVRSLLEKLAGATTRKELTAVAGQINAALRAGEVTADEREAVLVPAYKARMGEVAA